MRTLQLDIPRLATCCRTAGRADGLPILLLHGNFATGRWWEPLIACLPEEFSVFAPDLRGAGCAAESGGSFEIAQQALDLASIVDALRIDDFDLVAHSSSAATAIEYVLGTPDRVRSLVLVNPAPVEGVVTPLDAIILLEKMRDDPDLLRQAMKALLPLTAAENPVAFEEYLRDAYLMAPAAYAGVAEALGRWNRFADARRLTLPTLIVWGDADPFVAREAMTRTLVAIPGASNLEVLRGVGHAPMAEAPLLLAEKIVAFVTEDFGESEAIRRKALD